MKCDIRLITVKLELLVHEEQLSSKRPKSQLDPKIICNFKHQRWGEERLITQAYFMFVASFLELYSRCYDFRRPGGTCKLSHGLPMMHDTVIFLQNILTNIKNV